MFLSTIVVILKIWVILLDCKFLSIKLEEKSDFLSINSFESLSFLLKDSLTNIVMKNKNVEIIISNSIQVKRGKEPLRIKESNCSQLDLLGLIYKDFYEGLYITKQDGSLKIYPLSPEIDNPISFSTNMTWVARVWVGPMPIVSSIFYASSTDIISKIIKILFKNVSIQMFKNSSLIADKIYFYSTGYISTKTTDVTSPEPPKKDYLYYLEENVNEYAKEKKRELYFTKDIENSLKPYEIDRVCFVNEKYYYNILDAINGLEKALKSSSSVSIHNQSKDKADNVTRLIEQKGNIHKFGLQVNPDIALRIFEHIIGKLIFGLSIKTTIIMFYYPNYNILSMIHENGVFSWAIEHYIKKSLEDNGIKLPSEYLYSTKGIVKAEDYQGHVAQYNIERSLIFNHIHLFGSMKRILLLPEETCYETRITKTFTEIISLKSKFESFLISEIERMKKINGSENGTGLEIIFNREKAKIIINKLELENLNIPISRYLESDKLGLNRCSQWRFSLIYTKYDGNSSKRIFGQKYINSHELLLYLWKSIELLDDAIFIPVQSVIKYSNYYYHYHPHNIHEKIVQIKGITENVSETLLKLLLTRRFNYEIRRFGLKSNFRVEIDLVNPELVDEFLGSLSAELKTPITYKYEYGKEPSLKTFMVDNLETFRRQEKRGTNVSRDLTWNGAIKKLLAEPSIPFAIQMLSKRRKEYVIAGSIQAVYYKKFDLEKHIKHMNRNQLIRFGRVQRENPNFSVFFCSLCS